MNVILNDPGVQQAVQDFQQAIMANPELAQAFQDPAAVQQLLSQLGIQAKTDRNLSVTLKHLLNPAF